TITPASPSAVSNSPVCSGQVLNLTASFVAGATYSWTGPNSFTSSSQNPGIPTIQLADAGTYTVTATSSGCTSAPSTTNVSVTASPSSPSAGSNSPVCQSQNLNLTASFVPGGTYSWTGPNAFSSSVQNPTITNAQAAATGIYTVTVTSSGCTSSPSTTGVSINVPPSPPTAGSNSPVCEGQNINLSASFVPGGTYSWAGPNAFFSSVQNPTITNAQLTASGTYTVTATSSGCVSAPSTVNVNVNATPASPSAGSSGPVCEGSALNLTATFVAGAYSWTGPNSFTSAVQNPAISNAQIAASGTYTVTVTSSGCTSAPSTIAVSVDPVPLISISPSTDTLCSGGFSNLVLNYTVANTFAWFPGGFTASSITVYPSVSTTYTVTATNSITGCNAGTTQQVVVMANPTVTTTPVNVSCYGFNDGAISTSLSNAALPVTYLWSNGDQGQTISNLVAGTYTVSVSDANACAASASVIITEPSAISVSFGISNANCGQTNGALTATVSNGTAPYTYLWSNGDRTTIADSLSPGQYKLEIVDANGCQGMVTESIVASNGPVANISSMINVSCYGSNDGMLAVTVSGGTVPVSASWSNGQSSLSISGLVAGIYDLTLTDNSGCVSSSSYAVLQPSAIKDSVVITPATCGINDGAISVTASGGTGSYAYQWSANAGAATSSGVTGLGAGIYAVTITDLNGCSHSDQIALNTVSNDIALTLDSILSSNCVISPRGMIGMTTNGNAPPFNYLWNTGITTEDMINVVPGNYAVLVTDTNSCATAGNYKVNSLINGYKPTICLVSVDDVSNNNIVIWDKDPGFGISHYNIYRETSVQNNYLKVAVVPFDSLSQFNDTVANTTTHSWRYKISAEDSCGTETGLSDYQKTIHNVILPRIASNTVDLYWDYYDGAVFNRYYIYRELGMGWELIDSVSNTTLTYTDLNPPTLALDYKIEADLASPCIPSFRLIGGNNTIMTSVTKSRSNIKNNRMIGIRKYTYSVNVKVYPNPANDEITVELEKSNEDCTIEFVNVLGITVLFKDTKENRIRINSSALENGVYYLGVKVNGKKTGIQKLVIQH
ncbi:MAG: T9SS type A sorting domain-containing protein, partial [Bacteroidia bacterium]